MRNATFKDNIVFGREPNDLFYADILAACALSADLKTLPGRDRAEIGEKVSMHEFRSLLRSTLSH